MNIQTKLYLTLSPIMILFLSGCLPLEGAHYKIEGGLLGLTSTGQSCDMGDYPLVEKVTRLKLSPGEPLAHATRVFLKEGDCYATMNLKDFNEMKK